MRETHTHTLSLSLQISYKSGVYSIIYLMGVLSQIAKFLLLEFSPLLPEAPILNRTEVTSRFSS
jgi:hypothetical protein